MQVHFENNVSLKLMNRIRISGLFSTGVFCQPGKVLKTGFLKLVEKPIETDFIFDLVFQK
jgi:hypothetical protein